MKVLTAIRKVKIRQWARYFTVNLNLTVNTAYMIYIGFVTEVISSLVRC